MTYPLDGPITIYNADIGKFTSVSPDLVLRTWVPGERIIIGKYCSIADQVMISTGGQHRTELAALFAFDPRRTYRGTPTTTIGNDVWIGTGAAILGGACVGHGAVVASRAVVFSDVPPFAIVAGNPATVMRYRFSEETIRRLLQIAWWDWPDAKVFGNIDWFYRPISEFIDHFAAEGADLASG